MEFRDSETQKLLRDTARAYLRDKFPWERLYALERGDATLSGADLKGFAELGWLGLLAPEPGGGLSLLEAAVVIDECGYAAVPAPIAVSNIAADLLSRAESAEARTHLSDLVTGRRLYSVAQGVRRLGRPAHGGAPPTASLAVRGGRLAGALPFVPFAESADFVVAPLTIEGEAAFALVPLEVTRREPVRLLDRPGFCHVHFDGAPDRGLLVLARGPAAAALHERCDAHSTAFAVIELSGMMQRVLEMTGEYIANRVQFGQPIAKFQAARHHAADLLMQAETTRWTAYQALWSFQRDSADTRQVWLAKHWAIRAAQRAFEITHLLHGGIGVGLEYPLHLYTHGLAAFAVRDGTMNEMVMRTIESMGLRVVAVGH